MVNLDCMGTTELKAFRAAAERKGWIAWEHNNFAVHGLYLRLRTYARHARHAIWCREHGYIAEAIERERKMEAIYTTLPAVAKW